jgi:DNA-binding MarR family transcriptional regulator
MMTPHTAPPEVKLFLSELFGSENTNAVAALHKLRAVAHLLHYLVQERHKDEALSAARMRLLTRLAADVAVEQSEGLSPSELSQSLGVSRNTVSTLLNGLEDDGLIERQLHPTDRRRFHIRITSAGQKLVAVRAPEFGAFVNDLFGSLSADEQATLSALLDTLFHNLLAKAAEMGLHTPDPESH